MTEPKIDPNRRQRMSITVHPELIAAIDDWRGRTTRSDYIHEILLHHHKCSDIAPAKRGNPHRKEDNDV